MDRAYSAFKEQDEAEKAKLKTFQQKLLELKINEVLTPKIKPEPNPHAWATYGRKKLYRIKPTKKDLIIELAELLDCSEKDFEGQWVMAPLPFIQTLVERLNVKLNKAKK